MTGLLLNRRLLWVGSGQPVRRSGRWTAVAVISQALVRLQSADVRKAVHWNSPFYGVGGQGWFLSLHCFTHYVKLTFFRGASLLPLPPGRLLASGSALPRSAGG